MGNDFYNPTGHENEGLPSGRNLEGQITLWHPVVESKGTQQSIIIILNQEVNQIQTCSQPNPLTFVGLLLDEEL